MYPERSNLADSFHIESHASLLQRTVAVTSPPRTLDAIVVPTIRPNSLRFAIELAQSAGCQLVALCTTIEQAEAVRANHHLPPELTHDIFVTYVTPAIWDTELDFLTSTHPETDIEASCHIDIARKRNVGLLLSRICGWDTIMYLDDDIRGLTASVVNAAAAQVTHFKAVGFEVDKFPDNSVVCHANRLAGAAQDVFPGGSALLVDVLNNGSLFPPIYNEDWLFLFDAVQSNSLAVADRLIQLDYLPFRHSQRAASEEFGDVIAEGLYRLIHERGSLVDATLDYWKAALSRRSQLIDDIATRLLLRDEVEPVIGSALMALAAARKRLDAITPLACVSLIRAWRSDVSSWRNRLAGLPVLGDIRHAAKYLGLPDIWAK